ncbi:hypothetical protein BleG1_3462 [Shouchella lehensis G1]|uniref:Uncharacterized protein n=1 Tax=Shouchella lehensis G1 TaxID=1246626 RepID=A0A060M7G0_9BACI|nr:hypothetical protein BleG1_3462 [Shouchella lehensis G1]
MWNCTSQVKLKRMVFIEREVDCSLMTVEIDAPTLVDIRNEWGRGQHEFARRRTE